MVQTNYNKFTKEKKIRKSLYNTIREMAFYSKFKLVCKINDFSIKEGIRESCRLFMLKYGEDDDLPVEEEDS